MLLRVVASPAWSPTWRLQGQGLLVVVQRLRLVAQGVVDPADVVEGGRLAGLVAHLAAEGQGLLVVVQRLRLVAQGGVDPADVVEGGRLAGLVAHLASQGQRLLVVVQRLRLVAQGGVDPADVVEQRGGSPRQAAARAISSPRLAHASLSCHRPRRSW